MSAQPPILTIDLASPIPTYRQIVDGLRAQLVAGVFQPGQQLPTVRQLAADLGVHHNTVAEAYRLLAEEGWLDLARRRGATVRLRPQPQPAPDAQATLLQRLREVTAQAIATGLPAAAAAATLSTLAAQLTKPSAPSRGES
ncbi:MAG: GntR family transcriptional regulator [Bacillota bacterium]